MNQPQANRKLLKKLLVVAVLMFGFGYLLVPFYDVLCRLTGLNGKTGEQVNYDSKQTIDLSRTVTVQFIASVNNSMPWEFKPPQQEIKLHPGELKQIEYYAKNPTDHAMTGQAVPSVSPAAAAQHMHKTECFCFRQQLLVSGQEINMPVKFFLDKDLPADIHTVTLSYTLFDVTAQTAKATE